MIKPPGKPGPSIFLAKQPNKTPMRQRLSSRWAGMNNPSGGLGDAKQMREQDFHPTRNLTRLLNDECVRMNDEGPLLVSRTSAMQGSDRHAQIQLTAHHNCQRKPETILLADASLTFIRDVLPAVCPCPKTSHTRPVTTSNFACYPRA